MTKLPAVIIDTFADKALSLIAIRRTLRLHNVAKLYLLSDTPFYPGATFRQIPMIRSLNEYSDVALRLLPEMIEEPHFLLIQWDGMPINPACWDDSFLEFDYIGAPWIRLPGPTLTVGNGGFSLRSRRLLEAIRSLGISVDLAQRAHQPEDILICQRHRAELEERGMRFAPVAVAERFSFESGSLPRQVFGFHSTYNFPFFFSEDELLGFSRAIIDRQSNLNILIPYLDNLWRCGMHDVLRLSLERLRAAPPVASAVARVARERPHLAVSPLLVQTLG